MRWPPEERIRMANTRRGTLNQYQIDPSALLDALLNKEANNGVTEDPS
jgi:hypothetical protein